MSGETFARSGAKMWTDAGLGDEDPPEDCPAGGDPRYCCTYKYSGPPCMAACRAIWVATAASPSRRPWWRRLWRRRR